MTIVEPLTIRAQEIMQREVKQIPILYLWQLIGMSQNLGLLAQVTYGVNIMQKVSTPILMTFINTVMTVVTASTLFQPNTGGRSQICLLLNSAPQNTLL